METVAEMPELDGPLLLQLSHGRGLDIDEANEQMTRAFHSVILVAGASGSGKTTMLSTLLLMFQKGSFAGYNFAGSETLVGFEQRNFFNYCASKQRKPNTARTTETEFLHLRVSEYQNTNNIKDLLLVDLCAEEFRAAKDSIEEAKRLYGISRADVFVLLVDGGLIVDPEMRMLAKNEPIALLRSLLDCKALHPEVSVHVAITKSDKIDAAPNKDHVNEFVAAVENDIERFFAHRVRSLKIFKIAAHASDWQTCLGFGMEEMFPLWVDAHCRHSLISRSRHETHETTGSVSEYNKFRV